MAITAAKVMELRTATGAGMMECKKALEETGGDMEGAKDWLRKKGISVAQKKAGRETTEGAVAVAISPDKKHGAIVQLACETDFVARNEQYQELMGQLTAQVLEKGGKDLADQPRITGKGKISDLLTENVAKMGENLQLVAAERVDVAGQGVVGGYVHSNNKVGVLVVIESNKSVDAAKLGELAKDVSMHIAASQVSAISSKDLDPAVLEKEKEILIAQAKESGKPMDIIEKMVQGRISKFIKEISLLDQPFVKNPDLSIQALLKQTGKELGGELTVSRFVKYQF